MLKMPRELTTWPRPPQVGHVLVADPFSAPLPSHCSHASSLLTRDFLLAALRRLQERNLHVVTQIVPALRLRRGPAAAARTSRQKCCRAAEHLAENLARIVKTAAAPGCARRGIEGGMAVVVVGRARFCGSFRTS